MTTKGKLPANKSDRLAMRSVNVLTDSADAVKRSIRVVTATENPVKRYDETQGTVVSEVLLMDGMEMRPGRTQLPIVDSHDQSTVRNVLGSLRNVSIQGDEFGGEAYFASDATSQEAFAKMADGHISDFSITADPIETKFVPRGQSYTTSRGNVVTGPANVITRWMPIDASLVACGADDRSTVRRSYTDAIRRSAMDEVLLSQLAAMGMPEGMTDANQILAWVVGRMGSQAPSEAAEPAEPVMENAAEVVAEDKKPEGVLPMSDTPKEEDLKMAEKEVAESVARALAEDKARRKAIIADCDLVKIERSFADELIDSNCTIEEARARILRKISTKEIGQTVEGSDLRVTASEDDKFVAAARDGLIQRSIQSAGLRRPAFSGDNKPAAGSEDFAKLGLFRTAERFLARAKIDTQRMTNKDIALVALNHGPTINRLRIQREAYHTTGSFSNLMLDAANKTLLAGYEEAEYSWSIWARQAPSVADFKNINRIRFSESPNLEMVPENHNYPEGTMSDSKESYKVEKFGSTFSVSWETVVNDDLDAISRIPAMQGNAARRTQNQKVYEVLTANPTMSDGNALFSTSHASGSNYQTTGAAPSVTTLNAGFLAMMTQKGLNSNVTINVIPRFLIVPVALHATALEVVGSTSRPEVGGATAGNANTLNIYGPNGSRPLTVVSDPVLDASSAAFWYLAASPSQIDTVELTFLQGEESPVLENEWDYKTDTWIYKIRQTFAAKAIDWRGLYCNDGA